MPELPEVEVVVRELRDHLVGARIGKLRHQHPDVFLKRAKLQPAALLGCRVTEIWRRGKLLGIDLDQGLSLTVHLRMTGHLWTGPSSAPVLPHTHFRLGLDSGRELRFRDARRFGRVTLLPTANLQDEPFLARLGPEPFEISPEQLGRRLSRRTGSVKGALLNQSVVAGLGNIYVDEILFIAGIHPRNEADRLKPDERARLVDTMKSLLLSAIQHGGSTIRDFAAASGPGRYQQRHLVFGREGQACPRCQRAIQKIKVAGRGTHLCRHCQPRRRRVARRARNDS